MKPVYIIAEAGVNHNGDLMTALELVEKAKQANANCIKFQTFRAERIVTTESPKAEYQLKTTNKVETQFEMLKKLELNYDHYKEIIDRCNELEIDFLSTPYNKEDVDFLEKLGVNGYKIASGQLTELPFLEYVAKKKKKMIISTGMSDLSEIFKAVDIIRSVGNNSIVVLQCTTNYPSIIEEANLNVMNSIRVACNVEVGYSDHVQNNYACYAAVALGATIIEKHFTLDKSMSGPDHSTSLEPNEFAELVFGIRNIELSLGTSIKKPSEEEKKNIYGMKRSLVAIKKLKKGTYLDENMIGFKRPANGLSVNFLDNILGKELLCDIEVNQAFQLSHIKW